MPGLTVTEKSRLKQLEATISAGMNTFIEVGHALAEIKEKKLYLETHKTFSEYCEGRWNVSASYARRLKKSAEVYDNIKDLSGSTNGAPGHHSKDKEGSKSDILPNNEKQLRPLVGLEPEEQKEAWNTAVESANGQQPTAQEVAKAVEVLREPGDDTEEETKEKPEKPTEPEGVRDSVGHLVPSGLLDTFATLNSFLETDKLTRALQKIIDEISKAPGGELLRQDLQPTGDDKRTINKSEKLNSLKRDLKYNRPHSVCPRCKGKKTPNCKCCTGHGWIAKLTWDSLDDSIKENLPC